jgi:hypothetical protein
MDAAALWGLMPSADGPIEVTIAGHQTGHPNGVIVHRTKALHPSDSRIRERLPVTSPARTIFDIADRLPERTVERAIEEGLHRKRLRIDHLEAVLDRNPGRAAATILSKLLAQRTGSTISRSKTEEAPPDPPPRSAHQVIHDPLLVIALIATALSR